MSRRLSLMILVTLLPFAAVGAQCPTSTLEIELGTRVGPDGRETFQWFHQGSAPSPITPNDFGCALRMYAEDGYWVSFFFRAWVEDAGTPLSNLLINQCGLTRLGDPAQSAVTAALGGVVDAGDLAVLGNEPLRILPSFMNFSGLYSSATIDNVRGIAQPILRPVGITTHSCQRLQPWQGRMEIWTQFALPGRPWNDFWDGIYLGWGDPDTPYLDYSGFLNSAVFHQGGDVNLFQTVIEDAVEEGLFLDIQAFAFRSGLPLSELTITSDPITTSGVGPQTTGGLPRFKLSQPLTVRVPPRAISRGDLRLGAGGVGYQSISIHAGETLTLKAGYVTPGSHALVPTLNGPLSVPLTYVSPLYASFVVPLDAVSGPFDLTNAWGTLDGTLTGVPWGPMSLDILTPVNPVGR